MNQGTIDTARKYGAAFGTMENLTAAMLRFESAEQNLRYNSLSKSEKQEFRVNSEKAAGKKLYFTDMPLADAKELLKRSTMDVIDTLHEVQEVQRDPTIRSLIAGMESTEPNTKLATAKAAEFLIRLNGDDHELVIANIAHSEVIGGLLRASTTLGDVMRPLQQL